MDKTIYYQNICKRDGKHWLLIVSCALFLISCAERNDPVRLLFVGDILLSRNVKEEYSSRKSFPWERLRTLFQSADLVIGNLEGSVGDSKEQINPLLPSPVFAIDSTDIGLLKNAGFSAITIENNHSLDLGINGKIKTLSTLNENNIKGISFQNSPYFFTIKDCIISIITINLVMSRDSSMYEIPSIEINQKLRLARALSNIVIVSVHWGSELLEWPNNEQRKAAKSLISNGTDLIIGHHPHVVQGPELIDGKPVYFSLGNHLFDQKYSSTKEGMIADIEFSDGKITGKGICTINQKKSFYPQITGRSQVFFESVRYRKDTFTVNGVTIIPENIDLNNKMILKGYQRNQLLWKSHPMSLVTLQKIKIDNERQHIFSLERYYSSLDKETNIRPYVYSIDTKGITARWRGSALAWPIVDAQVLPQNDQTLCALHRGDAFILLGGTTAVAQKVAAYKWNWFGFNFITDSTTIRDCEQLYQ